MEVQRINVTFGCLISDKMEIKQGAHPTIPARGKKRFVIHHEKLYLAVHRYLTTRWFRYTVLFFIVRGRFSP